MRDLTEALNNILPEEGFISGEPMSRHTTFRVGGPADYFVQPRNRQQLAELVAFCRKEGVPYYILGNGSNLLVGDRGFRGVMITLGRDWANIVIEENEIRAGAGAMLTAISRQAMEHSLAGLEFASGIPGTLGGAVVMNAGAYGSDMSRVLKSVTVMTAEGAVQELPVAGLQLGYRTSCIPAAGYTVLEAVMELTPGKKEQIREEMDRLNEQRREKQPLEYPSAGSTFKRPAGYFAGKLIQDAGLRGFQVGGAQVSEKHCGFVINRDQATAADIRKLCTEVQRRVRETFGVELELEVKLLGEF